MSDVRAVQEHCDKPWWVSWEIIGKPLENGGFNIFNGNTIGKPWENGGFNIFNGKIHYFYGHVQ